MRIVIDANIAASLIVDMEYSEAARLKIGEWKQTGVQLHAPALWNYEVASMLRRYVSRGKMLPEEAIAGADKLWEAGIARSYPKQRTGSCGAQLGGKVAADGGLRCGLRRAGRAIGCGTLDAPTNGSAATCRLAGLNSGDRAALVAHIEPNTLQREIAARAPARSHLCLGRAVCRDPGPPLCAPRYLRKRVR